METNRTYSSSDLEALKEDFLDMNDKKVREYDVSNVRGSVRIRTSQIITEDEIIKLKKEVKSLNFPSPSEK